VPLASYTRGLLSPVRLHPITTQGHDEIVRYISEEITATETVFLNTDPRLICEISGSG